MIIKNASYLLKKCKKIRSDKKVNDLDNSWGSFTVKRTSEIDLNFDKYNMIKQSKDKILNTLMNELSEENQKLLIQLEDKLFLMTAIQEEKAYSLGFMDVIKIFK